VIFIERKKTEKLLSASKYIKCMNKYSYVIMNKYSFVNIINLEATRKLFLQLFSKIEEIFFYLLVFTKYFNVNYRKANKRLELTNRLKTKPKGVTLMIKELSNAHHRKECITMNNNSLINSYTQAFFTKKDREDTK
jgi:hypothetical protein